MRSKQVRHLWVGGEFRFVQRLSPCAGE
jgi:hypothetical protein